MHVSFSRFLRASASIRKRAWDRRSSRLAGWYRALGSAFVGLLFAASAGATESVEGEAVEPAPDGYELLPRGELFEPLVADVRWPRFSASHQWRLGTDDFNRVAAVSFGETFAFVRSPRHDWGRFEIGMQANLDAIFDLTAPSLDLANEDYFVAIAGAVQLGRVTTQARIYHLSSHLGDEFLISTRLEREGVSFEILDLLTSVPLSSAVRLYAGGGVLLGANDDFGPVQLQGGLEWTSPNRFASELLTPFGGVDLQLRASADWIPEVAVLAGLRLANPEDDIRRIEIFARYYHGRSPEGQFFRNTIDTLGLGIRLGF